MIKTLALFTPEDRLKLSCYALEDFVMLSPYFYIQGIVTVSQRQLFLFKKNLKTCKIIKRKTQKMLTC